MKRLLNGCLFYLCNLAMATVPFYVLRHSILRYVLKIHLGRGSAVHMGCFFTGRNIRIGSLSVLNRNCRIDGRYGVEIGDNVSISPEVYILSLTHDPQAADFASIGATTVIEDYVWVGVRAMIMPGVRLQRGCVVGAGAVVTRDVGPNEIVAGVPARRIGVRGFDPAYPMGYRPWFNTDS